MTGSRNERSLLRQFADCSDNLLNLGVVQTDSYFGEIGEYIACSHLKLERSKRVNKDVDAIDREGKRYQIKSRFANSEKLTYVCSGLNNFSFDYLVVIFFNKEYKAIKIVKVPASIINAGRICINCNNLPDVANVSERNDIKIPAKQRKAIDEFIEIFLELRKRGIINRERIVGDIGERYAAKKLGLKLSDNLCEKGYDAVDAKGIKYEIKTRRVYDSPRRVSDSRRLNNLDGKIAKYLIVVVLNREFECTGMWKVPLKNISDPQNARLTLVYHTPGTVTFVSKKVPNLKGKLQQANLNVSTKAENPTKAIVMEPVSQNSSSNLESGYLTSWWRVIGLLLFIYLLVKYLL